MIGRGLLTTIASILLVTATARGQQPRPQLSLSMEKWNFGTVDQGYKSTREVVVTNNTDQAVRIAKIGVTCGCIKASIDEYDLAPRGRATMTVRLDTTLKTGRIQKSVYVETKKGLKTFMPVSGTIIPVWWCQSNAVNLGEVDQDEGGSGKLRILVARGKEVKITGLECPSGRVTAEAVPFEEGDQHGYDVIVRLAPQSPVGIFQSSLKIVTDFASLPSTTVGVHARVVGAITVDPPRATFGAIKVGDQRTLTLTVRKRKGDGLVLEKVICTDGQITTEFTEKEPGKVWEIRVTAKPNGKSRRIGGRLFIRTNDLHQRMLPVFYHASVRK